MKLALILLAISGLLSVWTAQLRTPQAAPAIVSAARRDEQHAPQTPLSALSVHEAGASEVGAPPLFRAAATPAALAAPQPGETFSLVGLAGDGSARVAFLRDQADHQTFSARTGESVRDWTLSQANQRCVVLRKGRQRQNVCLS